MIEHKSIHRDKKSPLTAWPSAIEWLFFWKARGLGRADHHSNVPSVIAPEFQGSNRIDSLYSCIQPKE
jgi:hypothetical protein